MYSGTTLNKKSGHLLGVHQKIDRQAYRALKAYNQHAYFPSLRHILHFEGKHGPDGIKRKAPSQDEPWHFIDPADPSDTTLLTIMSDHRVNLRLALQNQDEQRAAFEAAWLAHAVVDGLTPAHHYPLEEKLETILGDGGLQGRTTMRKKIVLPGATSRQKLRNNWEFWGAKGVLTSHYLFEFGVASAILPVKNMRSIISPEAVAELRANGYDAIFKRHLAAVVKLNMYDLFCRKGWTPALARQTRRDLLPLIIQSVELAWLSALPETRR